MWPFWILSRTLMDHSLIWRTGTETPRFQMLATLREYAVGLLESAVNWLIAGISTPSILMHIPPKNSTSCAIPARFLLHTIWKQSRVTCASLLNGVARPPQIYRLACALPAVCGSSGCYMGMLRKDRDGCGAYFRCLERGLGLSGGHMFSMDWECSYIFRFRNLGKCSLKAFPFFGSSGTRYGRSLGVEPFGLSRLLFAGLYGGACSACRKLRVVPPTWSGLERRLGAL